MIEVKQLTKWFGPTAALRGVSFEVPAGEVVGLLGPNGAGKTTTLRILTGYLPATTGTALVGGKDVMTESEATRAQIGYLPESTPLYGEMRSREYLHFIGRLFGMRRGDRKRRIEELTEWCGLERIIGRAIGGLSKGNRQRVGLAQALMHDPPVLVLDEPTSGLDPVQVRAFRNLIERLKGKHTIVLSSHILPEVEKAADRVVMVDRGVVVAVGTPGDLRERASRGAALVVEAKGRASRVRQVLEGVKGVERVELLTGEGTAGGAAQKASPSAGLGDGEGGVGWVRVLVQPKGKSDVREGVSSALGESGIAVRELSREGSVLERVFSEAIEGEPAAWEREEVVA
ncbi:MAG: ABC transporter ATP-binding protein [Planctomycetota bacterium]